MKAVLMQAGRLWVDDIPIPEPGPGEVLVRSRACGICGSDLHAARHTAEFIRTSREVGGAFKLTTDSPVVLGHEFCCEVVEFGPQTNHTLDVGQLVCSVPALIRPEMVGLGYSDLAPGGFAEYMLLSEQLLLPVPAGLSADHAALTEPLAVGRHAVAKAGLKGDESLLVVGCGPVGLAVIAALIAAGAGPVIASDFSPLRRQLAERLGAHEVLDPAETNPLQGRSWPRQGGTVIFECVGVKGMIDQLFTGAPQDARLVIVGVCLEADVSRPTVAVNKELNVQYVLGYSAEEFRETLHWIADGKVAADVWITERISLEAVPETFESLAAPDSSGKVLVKP